MPTDPAVVTDIAMPLSRPWPDLVTILDSDVHIDNVAALLQTRCVGDKANGARFLEATVTTPAPVDGTLHWTTELSATVKSLKLTDLVRVTNVRPEVDTTDSRAPYPIKTGQW